MPRIYVSFVWHMHQPFYKDLATGEYQLPWTRMHALKDYYGMVKVLEEFPTVHQTFNLVPSMLVQIDEYARGEAADPFLRAATKPAEELTEAEQSFILRYFFQANPTHMVRRFPRYGELYDTWCSLGRNPKRARHYFPAQSMRDLQVLSQVAWFEEEFLESDPDVVELVGKERGYSADDQALMARKQLEILGRVVPVYRDFAQRGRIEISTTPFYHPILPLLCDSSVASISHPHVPLPAQFRYPADARHQLATAREYMRREFGAAPAGLWPSEGSVSDAAFHLAAEVGFRWAATDNGVLARTLHAEANCDRTYRPYRWEQEGHALHVIFRDHTLSDRIGFVFSKMHADEAAAQFMHTIRDNCAGILAQGRDALVPIILDGENAWEYYHRNGRPFLRELYRRIAEDPGMEAVTVSEALERVPSEPLSRIFPGSWINANFDVWIGAEEDNRAWDMLLHARQAYDAEVSMGRVPEDRRLLAFEELMIAEGSDWCWWYGPEHYSENRAEFDQLFRSHLANVYRALGVRPPEALGRPNIKTEFGGHHQPPSSPIHAVVDGELTSFFEWMGAGRYRVDARSGAMHGQRFVIRQLLYGTDRRDLFLRLDLDDLPGDLRLHLGFPDAQWNVEVMAGEARVMEPDSLVRAAFGKVLEVAVPLAAVAPPGADVVKLKLAVWQGALPLDSMPQEGWLELVVAEPADWPV
jgi:alpha-amylase/alpha-mannosidase (GH57 family)